MAVSEVDICNRALASIGTRSTISSIQPSDGSNEANQCALLYYPTRDALLRAAHWDFARAQINLTQLKSYLDNPNTCPVPWGYEYSYPSDCFKMRYILPFMNDTLQNPAPPLTTGPQVPQQGVFGWNIPIRFLVATDKDPRGNDATVLLTNQPNAIGVYTRAVVNPILFDAQFQEALVAALAAKLVPALALNMKLMEGQIKIAQGIIDQARMTNGNEGPMIQESVPDWIRVRESYGAWIYGGYFYQGWDAMPWPIGL